MPSKIVVVGGGIAGLSCAWRLHGAGRDVEVIEAQPVPGGNVRSQQVDGFLLERGPHTFLPSADDIFSLAREVGLEDQITVSRPAAKKRFIVRAGKLHKVFSGPGSFLTSRLLSFRGKMKLLSEPFRTKRRGDPGDTASEFFARRFGPEAARVLAGAFISGVYAGDPDRLSAPAAFPLFWRFEQEAGSMIRGAMRHRKQRKRALRQQGEDPRSRPRGLCSFREGLGQLPAAIAGKLGERCRVSSPVRALSRDAKSFVIKTDEGGWRADQVVVATPPQEAGRLLAGLEPDLAEQVGTIPMAPISVVHMGHHSRAEPVPDGFGFLAPRDEGIRTLGILFPSRLFDGRSPRDGDLFTAYAGGMTDPDALELDDAALLEVVASDLERLTGLVERPGFVRVARYPQAIPQFTHGHLDRMDSIRRGLGRVPGLFLAGNYLKGVGMKDAVAAGFEAAASILAHRERES